MSPQQPGTPDLDALMRHDEGCFPTNHACDCTRDARLRAALTELVEKLRMANEHTQYCHDHHTGNEELLRERIRQLEQDVQEARQWAEKMREAETAMTGKRPTLPWEKVGP